MNELAVFSFNQKKQKQMIDSESQPCASYRECNIVTIIVLSVFLCFLGVVINLKRTCAWIHKYDMSLRWGNKTLRRLPYIERGMLSSAR